MKNDYGKYTYAEIMSQGDTWRQTWETIEDQVEQVSGWIGREYDEMIFSGCGSTYNLSLSAASHWAALTKRPARGVPSSELWLYPALHYNRGRSLLVAVSRSGETTETIQAIKAYEERHGECLVISCYPESTMAKNAGVAFLAPQAQEGSVAQTRSFSSMFYLTQYLAGMAAADDSYLSQLERVPAKFSPLVHKYEKMVQEIAANAAFQHFIFLGSGLYYGLACEAMLKMKEISISVSEAFHFMEFRHGPMSMITGQSFVVGMVSDERRQEEARVLSEMKKLGATTLAITEDAAGIDADYVVELASGVSADARGVLYLPLLQLMAYHRSMQKGLNPDRPNNLESVVQL